ncbi:MAG: response regulator [Cyclonatronaceae bacterium]
MPDKKRILVVEDEMIVAQSICTGLDRMGYTAIGPAGNAADAVRLALREKPDLILMDIHLGKESDGIEAAQQIHKTHIIPIVYLTAHSDLHTIDRAKLTGPYGYIHKPFSENEIRSAIEMALYKHEKQLEVNRSERLLSTTLRNIGDAVLATDWQRNISYANPVLASLLGSDGDELTGKPLPDVIRLVSEKDGSTVDIPEDEPLYESGRWYLPDQCMLVDGEGGHIPVSGSFAVIADEDQNAAGIVAVLRDIRRERKHAETTRVRKRFESTINEIRTRLIQDKPPDIQSILKSVARSVSADRACLSLHPSGNKNIQDHRERYFWSEPVAHDAPSDADLSKSRDTHDFPERPDGTDERHGHQDPYCDHLWIELADGEMRFFPDAGALPEKASGLQEQLRLNGVMSLAVFPFRSEETGYVGAVNLFWRKPKEVLKELEAHSLSMMVELVSAHIVRAKAEDLLRSSEQRFRHLIQKSSDVITVLNPDGEFTYVAPSVKKVLGYNEEELEGKSAFDFVHKEDLAQVKRSFEKLRDRSVDEVVVECRFRDSKGQWVHLESIGSNLTKDPALKGIVINSRDISDRIRFQQELIDAKETAEAMSRVKTALLANMSHEMRTPLTGILGFATIMESELPEGEFKEMSTRIYASGQRLMETIESVLDLVKLEADKVRVQPERTNIIDEVTRNVNLHARPARHKDLELKVKSDHKELFVDVDRQLLGRILYNLLSNAIKYTDEGYVQVAISTDRDLLDEWLLIDVEDTGIGISTEFLPRVFDEFQQESSGYSRKYEGTGLGLTISRKLAKVIGGAITVRSKKGEGSTFTLRIPLVSSDGPMRTMPQGEHADKDDQRKKHDTRRILVVEDDFDSSEVARVYLNPDYDVVIVDSGEKALDEVKSGAYDLVLLDISLGPGMDGVKTLKAIRKQSGYGSVPVIALTAHALRGDADYYMSQGFSSYMSKPYKKKELLKVVTNYLDES